MESNLADCYDNDRSTSDIGLISTESNDLIIAAYPCCVLEGVYAFESYEDWITTKGEDG